MNWGRNGSFGEPFWYYEHMDLAKMLVEAGVVRRGKFKLTGGGTADFYIDMKRVMGEPRAFAAVVRRLGELVPAACTAVAF